MGEREKIIEIIAPFISAYGEDEAIADALIAAGIGDVSKWQAYCDLYSNQAGDIMEDRRKAREAADYSMQGWKRASAKCEELEHRAEVAEEERDKAQKSLVALCNEVAKIAIASDLVAIDNNTHKFFACKSDWSGTCKKCYFSCENYPFDMGRCEHNQYHWLNQQAEREIEEEK